MPLSREACELVNGVLRQHNSEWLWPSGRATSGHIEDPEPLAKDGFETHWSLHDLRRLYSAVGATTVPTYALKLLLNHALPKTGDVTALYVGGIDVEALRPFQQAISTRLVELGLPSSP